MHMKFAKQKDRTYRMLQAYMPMIYSQKENIKKQLNSLVKPLGILNKFF